MGEEAGVAESPLRWDVCEDLEIRDDTGQVLWAGPRYLRCSRFECHSLVTHGMVAQGGCACGNRRLLVSLKLSVEERDRLKQGYYPLLQWEWDQIAPELPAGQQPGWGLEELRARYA
jgi:hypothetical protein